MKFVELKINETFFTDQYGDDRLIKLKYFPGSCCAPPHNAKVFETINGVVQEKTVLLDDNTEVIPEIQKMSYKQKEEKIMTTEKMRLNLVGRGLRFRYNGRVYVHDPMARDGGGKVSVQDVETKEILGIPGYEFVDVEVETENEFEDIEDTWNLLSEDGKDGIQEDTESV